VTPWRARPRAALLVLAVSLGVAALVGLSFASFFWGLLSFGFLLGSFGSFLTTTRYALDEKAVSLRGIVVRLDREWAAFGGFHEDREGVTLVPPGRRSRWLPDRSVRLPFAGNREEVLALVSRKLAARRAGSPAGPKEERSGGSGGATHG
jgi:hypothetical protein